MSTLISDDELHEIKNLAMASRVGRAIPNLRPCQCCDVPVIPEPLKLCCEVE